MRIVSALLIAVGTLAGTTSLSSAGQTPAYMISTIAGGHLGDGRLGLQARVAPYGVATDSQGRIYIADGNNYRIRRLDPGTGIIATVAGNGVDTFAGDGGPATAASLNEPRRIAFDTSGNLYILDFRNCRVRRVDLGTGIISSVVGSGSCASTGDGGLATNAGLNTPRDVALDAQNNLYIAEVGRIRKVQTATGIISTIAGTGEFGYSGDGGPATAATLSIAEGIAVDTAGNVYIADVSNQRVRRVSAVTGTIQTVAGTWPQNAENNGDGGAATSASLYNPHDVAIDAQGNLYIAETGVGRVRMVSAATGLIQTIAGGCPSPSRGELGDGGPATSACLASPFGVDLDADGALYIADTGHGRVRVVRDGGIATLAGNGNPLFDGDGGPARYAWLNHPSGVTVDAYGNLYVADTENQRVRRIDPVTGRIDSITYDESAFPTGLDVDVVGNLYIADIGAGGRVQKLDAPTGLAALIHGVGKPVTIAGGGSPADGLGDGLPATQAKLGSPMGVAVGSNGNLYVTNWDYYASYSASRVVYTPSSSGPLPPDYANSRIRKISTATGLIATAAGSATAGFGGDGGPATSALLNMPVDVATDAYGNVYFVDRNNNRVRKIDIATGLIHTVAGSGAVGLSGDGGPATSAGMSPQGIALDTAGNLYIADLPSVDTAQHRIRRVDAVTGIIDTIAGGGSPTIGGDYHGLATGAVLDGPARIAVDKWGNIYFTEQYGGPGRLRKLTPMILPPAPTIGGVIPGDGRLIVSFTSPTSNIEITGYMATCQPVGGGAAVTGTGMVRPVNSSWSPQTSVSPITVYGLTNGTPYTCSVQALNTIGASPASASTASVSPVAGSTPMTLRDAIYLYNQPLTANGDKVMVSADCDVFQLVLDVTSGKTNLAMGQSDTLANALATQMPYVDPILDSDAMFAYALYQDQPVKSFTFNDKANPTSAAQIGTGTVFGYCYSSKPGAHVYVQDKTTCKNTYSDGGTTACTFTDNGVSLGTGGYGSLVLRDAIYLYGQDFNGRSDKTLVGENCDVFQLVLDVSSGYTDLAMGQAGSIDAAIATQVDYVDRIFDGADMFAYALYENLATKAFIFKDKANPASAATIGKGTAFGYCYSTDPNARVYLRDRTMCTDIYSNGRVEAVAGCSQ